MTASPVPIAIPDVTCSCERNNWERREGQKGILFVCRDCGYIGLIIEEPGTTSLHTVTLTLCSLCLSGAGGECHTPGCSLWMHRAPAPSIHLGPKLAPSAPGPTPGSLRKEIQRLRDERYEVACARADRGNDAAAERPFGYVDACDMVLRLLDAGER